MSAHSFDPNRLRDLERRARIARMDYMAALVKCLALSPARVIRMAAARAAKRAEPRLQTGSPDRSQEGLMAGAHLLPSAATPFAKGQAGREIVRVARRSRLARIAIGWLRRRRMRAELTMLDRSQRLDAGITDEALAEALRRPLSFHADRFEDRTAVPRKTSGSLLAAILVLLLAGAGADPPPAAAPERRREACAARDPPGPTRIEGAGVSATTSAGRACPAADVSMWRSSARQLNRLDGE